MGGGSLNNFLIAENKHKEEKASERVKINDFLKKKLGQNAFRPSNNTPSLGRKEDREVDIRLLKHMNVKSLGGLIEQVSDICSGKFWSNLLSYSVESYLPCSCK